MSGTATIPPEPQLGRISPANAFVNPDLTLSPVSFRFLTNMRNAFDWVIFEIGDLYAAQQVMEQQIAAIYNNVQILEANVTDLYNAQQALEAQVAGAYAQIAAITDRLDRNGFPQ